MKPIHLRNTSPPMLLQQTPMIPLADNRPVRRALLMAILIMLPFWALFLALVWWIAGLIYPGT